MGLCELYKTGFSSRVKAAAQSPITHLGAPEDVILAAQGNLAITYEEVGQCEKALQMKRDVYFGHLKLNGEEHGSTLITANNYAHSLVLLQRHAEAKALLRKAIPGARRVLGDNHECTFRMRSIYAEALYGDDGATLDDLREAVETLEDVERIARRVLGGAHPFTKSVEQPLRGARAALRAPETPPAS